MTTLYSLRTDGDQFRITKFVDGEVESSYLSTESECECPAGHRPSCRHRQMIPEMLARGLTDTHWFWDFDRHCAVDFNGSPKALYDNLMQERPAEADLDALAVPEGQRVSTDPLAQMMAELAEIPGVSVHTLDNPVDLHNAIADAVGEPRTLGPIARKPWRRL
jgi:hypothetical protein